VVERPKGKGLEPALALYSSPRKLLYWRADAFSFFLEATILTNGFTEKIKNASSNTLSTVSIDS
jgi:hypothetical protein